jgi:hypothetical protein
MSKDERFGEAAQEALRLGAWRILILVDGMDVATDELLDPVPIPGWKDPRYALAMSLTGLLNDLALACFADHHGFDPRSQANWPQFAEQYFHMRIRPEFRPSQAVVLRILWSSSGWRDWAFPSWPEEAGIGTLFQLMSISREELRPHDRWDIATIYQQWSETVFRPWPRKHS